MPRHRSKGPIQLTALLLAISVLTVAHSTVAHSQTANSVASDANPYTLNVTVDEVSLTFHVADFHGIPIDNLSLADIRLLDNGKKPRQVFSFEVHRNLPVHFGILLDTSPSMMGDLSRNRWIVGEYLTQLLRPQTDSAFLMRFDSESRVMQNWTTDPTALDQSLQRVDYDYRSRISGTAIFDSVYKACRDQFGTTNPLAGNFILLFTDGEDNASHARLEDDIDICQKANTAIYIFNKDPSSKFSKSQKILKELAAQTGGLVFFDHDRGDIWNDLRLIDANLRSQYRIVYKPETLKRDGSFHRIKLASPTRGGVITARSGYYATP